MALRSGRVGIHPSQVDPITGMLINVPTPGSVSFEDLSDAQITDPEVGQTLQYNGTGWQNVFASTSPTTLADLQDVQITEPEDGDYLMYDSVNSKWINSGEAPAPTYTDLTVTMYGAVEDTISFIDAAGISHSEVFASGQSSKTVTFKINPSGSTSITFTSAVAKNPNNLTADYSKSITLTDATTEIKVMPDNALYWWGYNLLADAVESGFIVGSSYTYQAPTFDTNKVTLYTSGSYKWSAVEMNELIAISTLHMVAKSSNGLGFSLVGTKAYDNVNGQTDFSSGNMEYKSFNAISPTTPSYAGCVAINGTSGEMYALWYE